MEELMKDVAELEYFESQAKQQGVKNILSVEVNKLHAEITKLRVQNEVNNVQRTPSLTNSTRRYQVKLTNYAWDQSSKFVKFYVTIPKVQTIPAENITCRFTNKTLELEVKDLDSKDHLFAINNLLYAINPEECSWKIKSDVILINAAKVIQKKWEFVTETEKRSSDAKKAAMPDYSDTSKDPSEGLMSLMKKMYEEGDDEMKRTISKVFHESQSKKAF